MSASTTSRRSRLAVGSRVETFPRKRVRAEPETLSDVPTGLALSPSADAGPASDSAGIDGWSPSRTANQAEGVAGWVGVHVVAMRQAPSSQRQDTGLGGDEIVHHDVEVELLRPGRVGPSRRLVTGCELESEPRRRVVFGNHHPVIGLVGHRQSDQLGVEGSQGCRVWAVDDHVVSTSDHFLMFAHRSGSVMIST